MQDQFSIVADILSGLPKAAGNADEVGSAMDYLLLPITEELLDRASLFFAPESNWRWFDFDQLPPVVSTSEVALDSFFDLSFPLESADRLDGIVINLQLGWLDFERTFALCRQWLKPGGQLFFSTFGPDTLFELREAWHQIDEFSHVHDFPDLHLLGDQLTRVGFEKPILDTDWQGVEFEDIDLLMSDLRLQGFNNLHQNRRKTLTGKGRFSRFRESFDHQSPVQITFEVIYGFAKVPLERGGTIRVRPPSIRMT